MSESEEEVKEEVSGGNISAMWIGGPADGMSQPLNSREPFRVIGGTAQHPEYRIVTPKQLPTGRWILNYYEGVTEDE